MENLGYQTFNSSRNFADLWIDTGNGNIYTNIVNVPEDKILLNYTGNSEFSDYEDYNPIPVQERNIKPLAIEKLFDGDTVPDWAVGGYLLIGADQNNGNSIVGIVYDENGNYIVDIGSPEGNFAVNQTENLFEFDFNRDGKKAGLLENEYPIYDNLERIETNWWTTKPVKRDYYTADTSTCERIWIYLTPEKNWYLHGKFW